MIALSQELLGGKELRPLLTRLGAKAVSLVSGPDGIHKAHLAAALRRITGRAVIVIVPEEAEAGRYRQDIASLTGEDVYSLTAREFTFYDAEIVSREVEHERIRALNVFSQEGFCAVATPDGLMQRTAPPDTLRQAAVTLRQGDRVSPDAAVKKLLMCGYERTERVEGIGQFSRRGGILDLYSPSGEYPVRIEFFGNEIDAMGTFDTDSQRRVENIQSVAVLPVAESLINMRAEGEAGFLTELKALRDKLAKRKAALPALSERLTADYNRVNECLKLEAADRYMGILYGKKLSSGADYIPDGAIVILCEPSRLAERAKNYLWRLSEDCATLIENGMVAGELANFSKTWEDCVSVFSGAERSVVMLDNFRGARYPLNPRITLTLTAKQLPSYGGSLPTAADDIKRYSEDKYRIVVLCGDERKARAMYEFLQDEGISCGLDYKLESLPNPGQCAVSVGGLSAGMEYPNLALAIITEGQIMSSEYRAQNSESKKRRKGHIAAKNKQKLLNIADLAPGDLVVHETHGIGRFVNMCRIEVDGVDKEYIQIAYRGTDKVYVPATQLDLVTKYIGGSGGDAERVKLSKLGGTDWVKAKNRAKAAAKDLAQGLIELYAARLRVLGHSFSADSGWQRDFEDAFPYNETDDQLKVIAEIKTDMEKSVPMDRLLCGDVGFGKTEVALRAVMKCVSDGKQAAILVPTTVLAQQHYVTTSQRFANFPVTVDALSRFKTGSEITRSLKAIKAGSIDIVIGTHRILSKDIEFKDLGLLVVDEEQRFGVSHKEKLKKLAKQVDVLTMSATPIPRTLNMALAGLRDMSSIEEPPAGRHPVQTYVLEHDWSIVADAIRREIGRGGQVYYLHNRIETIDRTAAKIREVIIGPDADEAARNSLRIGIAHGGMSEDELSDIMERVGANEVQILVCTTIIEAGIDIPNVNTLIIEDADRLGLAQLHQIRGRVGRSSRHAFAYFTFRTGKVLSEIAAKRLSTIREFAAFNSGVKIALRDLEIRGAGNLLGAEQSGHMQSVGFDMYLKLLDEAVLEEKGEPVRRKPTCSADLSVSASISESYVPSSEQRMDVYRRIAMIDSREEADDMIDELGDRYGDIPDSVLELINVALLRAEAAENGVTDISQKGGQLVLKFTELDIPRLFVVSDIPEFAKRIKFEKAAEVLTVNLKLTGSGTSVIDDAIKFVRAYAENSGE
ncbi:MAG: transcription-repair coupling factor [Oscillospiraceae bacterium]|jgi:transcription-repair coupling factor (superfamily II helicase)|nr:transcription-repair coupling factor [Oscillospiraceae bacterium]